MMIEPEIEALPGHEQARADDDAYRRLLGYPFERSRFYREKLSGAGLSDAASAGGLADIAALPFTEKDELRASRSEAGPIGTPSRGADGRGCAHLFDERHDGHAELYPADQVRPRRWVRISSRSYSAPGVSRGDRIVTAEIELAPRGTLPRSDYKFKLVDRGGAA